MRITRNPDYTGPFWTWLKASAKREGDPAQCLAWILVDDPESGTAVTLDDAGAAFRGWCSLSPHWPSEAPYPLTFDRSRRGSPVAKAGGPSVTLRVRLDPEVYKRILAAVAADPEISSKSEYARIALEEALRPRRGAVLRDEIGRLRGWLAWLDDPGGPSEAEISQALRGEPVPECEA